MKFKVTHTSGKPKPRFEEFNSLEELIKFLSEEGECIIWSNGNDQHSLEIYDTYRE